MRSVAFSIVDVFAEEKYAGNQLAVVRRGDRLASDDMQKIAREINFSETTFIIGDTRRRGGFDVRIFTPAAELPFAGHPTLGTAYVIQQDLIREPVRKVVLNLKVGPIPVSFSYRQGKPDVLWMRQIEPQFGQTMDVRRVAPVLGLKPGDLLPEFPVQEVSTGIPFVIVPVRTLEAVKRSRFRPEKLAGLTTDSRGKAFLLFSSQAYDVRNDLNVRVFAHCYGVAEDPATGSANGCLAGYLVRHRFFGRERIDIRVEQGYEIGRPSLLLLRAGETAGRIEVLVGGRVVLVARGKLA
ncbi:MAG: PhzF family phenazine biosynthesis protein [Candidatus Aminicenantes bacterium]|nr:PhzF family phenazine biosynthesis protein [Candidatus Aminicenantes bacterium]